MTDEQIRLFFDTLEKEIKYKQSEERAYGPQYDKYVEEAIKELAERLVRLL